jgi:hypothetical protein
MDEAMHGQSLEVDRLHAERWRTSTRGRNPLVIIRNPADDRLQTLCRVFGQQECSRPVSGLASLATSPSHGVRARPDGRHVTPQWPVSRRLTTMQPHWLTVAGAAEALRSLPIAHLVPVSPASSPKQAPDAWVGTTRRSPAVVWPETAAVA